MSHEGVILKMFSTGSWVNKETNSIFNYKLRGSYRIRLAMGCLQVLIFFLLQATSFFSAEQIFTPSRSSYFTTMENKKLKGYVVKRLESPSLVSCGQQCLRNTWCTSINYKMFSENEGKGTCELNKHNISLINNLISRELLSRCY